MLPDVRSTLAALHPSVIHYGRFALALVLGTLGGWLFARLNMPLPWMLGSMLACTLGALVSAPIDSPKVVRPPMTAVIGVMLGAGFSPDLFDRLLAWIPTLLGLVVFMAACGVACIVYFRRVGSLDPVTAYYAGMPGGLVEMVIMGEERGGNARTIALLHSARVMLLVFTLPFLVQWITGTSVGNRDRLGVSMFDAPWTTEAWLLGTAIVGSLLGLALRLRAAYLLGPMVVSAGVHLAGLTNFAPPFEIVNLAQLVLGTSIGCSFAGTAPRHVLRILALSLGSTAILLAITFVFAWIVSQVSAYGLIPLILAYSPGGLAEMSLVALALQIEVAFVAGHHVIRVFLVLSGANLAFALMNRWAKP
jgi:membrane AbrB-like protein